MGKGKTLKTKQHKRLTTPQIIVIGFAAAILAGTLLLMLPVSSADGRGTGWLDALFTSATSICVTGLVTVPTALHWSLFGKIVILFLIQLGGLGVITVTISLFILMRRHISLRERILVQDYYNLDSPQGMVRLIIRIIKGVTLIEGIGAGLLMVRFIPKFGPARGIWYAVFHSVSAFCNAGLDILGEESLACFVSDWYVNLVVILLIVTGGIGFPVWWDILHSIRERREKRGKSFFGRLTLHSKLALTISAFLIAAGTVLTYCLEYSNPETLGACGTAKKWLRALFYSVTMRTAGFYTVNPAFLRPATVMLSLLWMLIGGSPAGTAGGMKTTTVGMLCLIVWAQIRGRKHAEAFGRRVAVQNLHAGLAVVLITISVFFASSVILMCTEPFGMEQILYEAASAIGTVGLSMGITPFLSVPGRLIIILCMFIGRIGPITLATAFALRRNNPDNLRELPEQKIIIG